MGGTLRILKRFIGATMLISLSLLLLNFLLLLIWVSTGTVEGKSPAAVVRHTAEGLQTANNGYVLEAETAALLEDQQVWAMLISSAGLVTWGQSLPEELPAHYSLTDVAKLSMSYLMDYPVFVWEHAEGLIVIGYPKDSLVKYQHILPTDWVKNLPLRALLLLIGNLVLVLIVALLIGSRLLLSIRPLTQGIQKLAADQEVQLEPKGMLADLAQSVNHTSSLLHQKNASLKSRDEARSNWIAGISHDIRTPLSMVLGYASELEEHQGIPPLQRKHAGIIRYQAEKLRTLVSDLNLVSMLEYEMQPLTPKALRLAALTRQVASDIINAGLEPSFTLEMDDINETAQIYGDERLLLRAMTNLVHNAIRHNPQGCDIRLGVELAGDKHTCRFIVLDNGRGIAPEELADVLELPFSANRKYARPSGHGLGLPMAFRIAKAHHGRLALTNGPGAGLTAELELPCLEAR
ncbi:HAMP domain-containing sensor histidine kinase [Paenibacillus sp. FSL H8-0537]|uniref:sensor histidine kinase n=1 Tax=Paenibacillus sp. FSL H8-0537 TaxID=2921399 RepID=UPI003100DCDB